MNLKNILNKTKRGIATALAGAMLSLPVISNAGIKLDRKLVEKTELAKNNINLKDRINNYKKEYKPEIGVPELALNTALAYFMTTYTHELGHCAIAKAYGLDGIKIDPTINNEKAASFSYEEDAKLSNDQEALLNLGSSIATRTNYEALNYLIEQDKIPKRLEPFASTYALLLRLDMPYQLMIGARNHFLNGNNDYLDYEKFVDDVSDANHISKDTVYGILIGAELLDLYLDRKEIKNHFKRALGKEIDFEKDKKDLDLDVIYDENKIGLSLEYKF
ncbi:MAG: hypothetical protein KJ623_02100 [Nanoarchaeota archaeon]|nr:hypothetical protein [Nanoarchaeota archaeon]MBU0962782.1 hypothetical protein [Nanoarchaeota archaeon]